MFSLFKSPSVGHNFTKHYLVSLKYAGLEFAHSEAPADMKGVMMGLFISTEGFGTLLAAAIIIIIKVAVNCNKKGKKGYFTCHFS